MQYATAAGLICGAHWHYSFPDSKDIAVFPVKENEQFEHLQKCNDLGYPCFLIIWTIKVEKEKNLYIMDLWRTLQPFGKKNGIVKSAVLQKKGHSCNTYGDLDIKN